MTPDTLLRQVGIAIMRPAVKGVLRLLNEEKMVENFSKFNPGDKRGVSNYLQGMRSLLQEVGLEDTVFYYIWDEIQKTVEREEQFYQSLHEAIRRAIERWQGQPARAGATRKKRKKK